MGDVTVLPVPENSIIWLHNIEPVLDENDESASVAVDLVQHLADSFTHRRFVVLTTGGDGVIDVLGADELVDRVRAALTDAGIAP